MAVGRLPGHRIERFRLERLDPSPYNPRKISPEALAALQASVSRFGLVQPVVWNERSASLVAGQQRVTVLRALGEVEADVVVVDLAPGEERALNVALNSPAVAGEFTPALAGLLQDIRADVPELYEALLMDRLAGAGGSDGAPAGAGGPDANRAPARPENPVSEPGVVWALGDHRLVCGDARSEADVRRALDGSLAQVVFTDPPYNMDYRSKRLGGMKNDRLAEQAFIELVLAAGKVMLDTLDAGGSFYVCMSAVEAYLVFWQFRKLAASLRPIVWCKPSSGLGQQEYRPQHEIVLYGVRAPRTERTWHGGRRQSDVWRFEVDRPVVAAETEAGGMKLTVGRGLDTLEIELDERVSGSVYLMDGSVSDVWHFARPPGEYLHPTQKPVELVLRALGNSSNEGDTVLDPFAGSGTTIVGGEMMNRRVCAVELDPGFCDVCCQRYFELTSKSPVRVGDGALWTELHRGEQS